MLRRKHRSKRYRTTGVPVRMNGTSSVLSQTNGIFELQVTNEAKETETWTIDLKNTGTVYKGNAKPKADVTIILSDDTLTDLASGKV